MFFETDNCKSKYCNFHSELLRLVVPRLCLAAILRSEKLPNDVDSKHCRTLVWNPLTFSTKPLHARCDHNHNVAGRINLLNISEIEVLLPL